MDYEGIIGGANAPPKYKPRLLERIFKPYDQYANQRTLLRCQSCGDLLWKDSPQEILARHKGHKFKEAIEGSFWEHLKIKFGLIK